MFICYSFCRSYRSYSILESTYLAISFSTVSVIVSVIVAEMKPVPANNVTIAQPSPQTPAATTKLCIISGYIGIMEKKMQTTCFAWFTLCL